VKGKFVRKGKLPRRHATSQVAAERTLDGHRVLRPVVAVFAPDANQHDVGIVWRALKHREQAARSVSAVDRREQQDAGKTAALHLGGRVDDCEIKRPEAESIRPDSVQ